MVVTPGRTSALLVMLATPCFAHHGVAPHYDADKPVTVDGVIVKFEFINPHSFVYLQAIDVAGNAAVWQCELASRSVLARNGLTADLFAPGKPVRIEGIAGRQNPVGCAVREAHFQNGSVLRASTLFGATPATRAESPAADNSIVGVWAMKTFAVSMYDGVLTEAGERARAAFDPIKDDPAIYCDPASPVRFWVNVNEPFEIRREQDAVIIDHQFMDSQRVVHLNAEGPSSGVARTTMGHSLGSFDGETLRISTSRFTAATLEPRRAVMHTQNLTLTEMLEVNAATHELEITWTIDDPEYFKEPLTQKEFFVRTERPRERYDCKPGYQQ